MTILDNIAADPVLALTGLVLGYLFGSIPFGILVSRIYGLGDPRTRGSGNIGATNVLRAGHKGAAALTLAGDALKGTAAVLIAAWAWGTMPAQVAALGAFLGHVFPVWLGFRGGKGVATYLGILFALSWPVGLLACAVWLGMALSLRYSSLSALVMAASVPLWFWAFGPPAFLWVAVLLGLLILWSHRTNIRRLLAGTEPRIGRT